MIESVLAQTYTNWEMIIVDDMSKDNTVEIIEKYMKINNNIKLVKLHKNCGHVFARNRATKKAKGEYIAFLDADDTWLPNKLEVQLQFMIEHNLAFTYSSYNIIDENSNYLSTFHTKSFIGYKELLKTNIIGCLTAIYSVKKIGKMYMENIGHEDYVLWLRILKKIKCTMGICQPLANYRILNKSVSSNKFKAALWQWKIYREIENIGLFKSIYYFIFYVYYGIKKHNFGNKRIKE
jgi:glycosyltransferase involved in cell wall biosynthesis